MKKISFKNKAFTLIELLIVISIIGILSSIILVSTNDTRAKGRDTKRIADISQLRIALELYYSNNSSRYPETNSLNILTHDSQKLIAQIPTDPSGASYANSGNYFYYSNGDHFHLGAKLESANAYLLSDHDRVNSGGTGDFEGKSEACGATSVNSDNLDKCYDIYR